MVKVIEGDLFNTEADIVAHQVNCQGRMNSGVAKQVKEKYPMAYASYLNLEKDLGTVTVMDVSPFRKIANLYAQEDFGYDGKQYTDLEALRECFQGLNDYARDYKLTIAMPYNIGCGLGGADWNEVYQIINDIFEVDVELWRLD